MNIKKTIISVLVLAFSSAGAMAEDVPMLYVIGIDGSITETPMSEVGKIVFGSSSFAVESKSGQSADHKYADVKRVDFGKLTSISNVVAEARLAVWPTVTTSTVSVKGAEAGAAIRLFNLSGSQVMNVKAVEGVTTVDLSPLSAGMYVLTVGDNSVKIIKK